MTGKPMDPERLARMREHAGQVQRSTFPKHEVAELLADRDYHAQRADDAERDARVERATREATDAQFCRTLDALDARDHGNDNTLPSSARVRVEAEDIERVGVTRHQIEAWLHANRWRNSRRTYSDGTSHWLYGDGGTNVLACSDVAQTVHTFGVLVYIHRRPGLDILDEMAALEVPS
jgi:hypothetical protein